MLKIILAVLIGILYTFWIVDMTEFEVKKKIERNCHALNAGMLLLEREEYCKDMVNGWRAHHEDPNTHQ